MSGSVQEITYDQLTNQIIDSSNITEAILVTKYPKLYRNNTHAIIRVNLYSDATTSTKTDLTGATLSGKLGSVGSSALITIPNGQFNDAADWSQISMANGKICFNINTSGAAVDSALGSMDSKQYVINIQATQNGENWTAAQFNVTLTNTPD